VNQFEDRGRLAALTRLPGSRGGLSSGLGPVRGHRPGTDACVPGPALRDGRGGGRFGRLLARLVVSTTCCLLLVAFFAAFLLLFVIASSSFGVALDRVPGMDMKRGLRAA